MDDTTKIRWPLFSWWCQTFCKAKETENTYSIIATALQNFQFLKTLKVKPTCSKPATLAHLFSVKFEKISFCPINFKWIQSSPTSMWHIILYYEIHALTKQYVALKKYFIHKGGGYFGCNSSGGGFIMWIVSVPLRTFIILFMTVSWNKKWYQLLVCATG